MSMTIPVDDDLALRLVEPHHAEEIFPAVDANREHIGRWISWVEMTRSAEDTLTFTQQSLRGFADRKQFSVSVLEQGSIVGGTGWTDWKQMSEQGVEYASADIGYWLPADAIGRGVMTRCVQVLLERAFSEYGLHRLTIRCEPNNAPIRAIPQRLGFTHEGSMRHVFRWGERWVDHHLFSLLADEWKEQQA